MKAPRYIPVLISAMLLLTSAGQAVAQDWQDRRDRGERRERVEDWRDKREERARQREERRERAREQEDRGERGERGDRGREAREGRRSISLDQVVAMAERRFDARVVRAETHNEDGRTVYVLRLLNDAGRVWKVRVDAATGEFL